MGISKSDFVKNLLKDKSINSQQREKVFDLVARDFVNSDVELKRISEEIKGIKENVNLIKSIEEIESGLSELKNKQNTPIKLIGKQGNVPEPNPKHVADFMSLFNQRDGLKYLTHDYDENSEFDIDTFLINAHKVFNKGTKKLNIPQSLWRIVKQFAFDSKQTEWTSISKDYKKSMPNNIGWATKELRDWSKQNHLHPIRNEEYKKIINDFKRITRIESSNLEKLIDATLESIFENEIENFEIIKTDLSKADFYSHVGFLKTAFETIFEEIKKHSDSPEKKKITIKYERSISDEGYYLRKVVITHHNSFPDKELELYLKEWQGKGNMGKIIAKLKGYCHWSVETMIDDNPTKVNILKEKETPEYEIIKCKTEELPKGFTHILTFYYK
ncbi:hypothetical protein [Psychroserpens jangbogonensis]|uniref:hypothetical protein n=1 Tax=Psychroserpens jangbogonensis TaxID=1484460 RepID=UPI00053E4729|nr:hypothetical protein [Psychroserpens jangbogonensis]